MKFRAVIALSCAVLAGSDAAEPARSEWTVGELRAWFTQFAQSEPDGERGLVYNGTDATHHRFSALVAGEWVARDVEKSALVVPEERPFAALSGGQRGHHYYVDPARDFIRVPNPRPPAPETRSLAERLNAVERSSSRARPWRRRQRRLRRLSPVRKKKCGAVCRTQPSSNRRYRFLRREPRSTPSSTCCRNGARDGCSSSIFIIAEANGISRGRRTAVF